MLTCTHAPCINAIASWVWWFGRPVRLSHASNGRFNSSSRASKQHYDRVRKGKCTEMNTPSLSPPLQTITKAPSHSTNRMCSRPLIWCSFRCLMTRGMFKGRWWRWGLRAATVPLQVGTMKHTAYNGVHVRHWIRDEDVRVRHHSN